MIEALHMLEVAQDDSTLFLTFYRGGLKLEKLPTVSVYILHVDFQYAPRIGCLIRISDV